MINNITIDRFWGKVDIQGRNDCWEWIGAKQSNGYGNFSFNSCYILAHRFCWLIYFGKIPDGLFVLHHCDNRRCLNPKHLFLGTQKDNLKDMDLKGRRCRGEKHHNSKLSENQIYEIRKKYIPWKYTQKKLSEEYGVSHKAISLIVNRKRWAWLK